MPSIGSISSWERPRPLEERRRPRRRGAISPIVGEIPRPSLRNRNHALLPIRYLELPRRIILNCMKKHFWLPFAIPTAVFSILWIWLPTWSPQWVVRNCPFDDPVLRGLLSSQDRSLIYELSSSRAITLLKSGFNHHDARIRTWVVLIAGATTQIDTRRSPTAGLCEELYPGVLHALEDDDSEVRAMAAAVIDNFHDPSCIEPLRQLVNDPHPSVSKSASESLARLGKTTNR
jgi:hypothetical protein